MKIKTKKQLNLPQLIEWAMNNEVDNSIFIGERNLYNVCFNKNGLMYFNTTNPIPTGETFTVTIEEEITEDTVLSKLVIIYDGGFIQVVEDESINTLNKIFIENIYMLNDDLTMTLIWTHDKGLVE